MSAVTGASLPKFSGAALADAQLEMLRQFAKWGEQNHPSTDPAVSVLLASYAPMFGGEHRTAPKLREHCERQFADGRGTWADVAAEEFAEALDAARYDGDDDLYGELVQCAAVFLSWAASVRRAGEVGES